MSNQDFEVVLGSKQILSVVFLIVVVFGVCFLIGYSAGYDRADLDRELAAKTIGSVVKSSGTVRIPDALLKNPLTLESKLEIASSSNDSTEPEKTNIFASRTPTPTAPTVDNPRPPRSRQPSTESSASATIDSTIIARSIHLQVAALRVQSDARLLADKLTAKGYPASLFSHSEDEWVRVLVGPFVTTDAAKQYRRKLKAEGFDSILRKP